MMEHKNTKTIGIDIPITLYEKGWRGTNFQEMLDQMFQHLYDNKESRAIMKKFKGSFIPGRLRTPGLVNEWDYEVFMDFMSKWKGEEN